MDRHLLNSDESMDRTIVELTVPFTFIEGGEYLVSLGGNICVISIYTEQSHELATRIYRGIQFMGDVTSYSADHHGLFEISRVVLGFPYLIQSINGEQLFTSAEVECVTYLNRLLDVLKYLTNKYWLAPLSSRDLYFDNIETISDVGERRIHRGMGPKSFNPFNLPMTEQLHLKREIDQILLKEKKLPFFNSTFLDSFNAFDTRRFNEAVILINTAFEGYVPDFLISKLLRKGCSEEDARKDVGRRFSGQKRTLHKVLTTGFKEIVGKSQEDDDKNLWQKFEDVREKRKSAVHPYISQLNEEDAINVISNILEIINWIKRQ
jgi:hypothetical protein